MSFLLIPRVRPNGGVVNGNHAAVPDEARAGEIAQAVRLDVARLRAAAEAEGRAKGEAEGRGLLQAQAASLAGAEEALRAAWRQLAAPLAETENDLADLILDLAFELARHLVGVEVAGNPASLKPLVTRLIQEAAIERGMKQSLVVRLNPADHAAIEPIMALDNAHLLADAAVAQGGALVEIIAPNGDPLDKTEWDATIEARAAALRLALSLNGAESAVPA
jgi:flagellar biosynthesis/type III secretory pathway protein FliH